MDMNDNLLSLNIKTFGLFKRQFEEEKPNYITSNIGLCLNFTLTSDLFFNILYAL